MKPWLAHALLMLAASGAAAQSVHPDAPGGLVSRHAVTLDMAQCIVRRDPEIAARFVAFEPIGAKEHASDDRQQTRTQLGYVMHKCVRADFGSVTMGAIDLRGAIAEALLLANDSAVLNKARALPSVLPTRIVLAPGATYSWVLFDCAVAAEPLSAIALIDAPAAGPGEAAAFAALGPSFQACVPADAALKIRPSEVRMRVATALYLRATGVQPKVN